MEFICSDSLVMRVGVLLSGCFLFAIAMESPFNVSATTYFLVGPRYDSPSLRETYVLPISKEAQIREARAVLALPLLSRQLIGATIAYGKDGVNRNYFAPDYAEWNWHVVELIGFGDAVIGILDGKPSQWESGATPWPQDRATNTIGFSAYTLLRELGETPLELRIVREGLFLDLTWSTPGSNWVYTVESADATSNGPDGMKWSPLPNGDWPVHTNKVRVAAPTSSSLFRIQASQAPR